MAEPESQNLRSSIKLRSSHPGAVQGVVEARDVDQPHQHADDGDDLHTTVLASGPGPSTAICGGQPAKTSLGWEEQGMQSIERPHLWL